MGRANYLKSGNWNTICDRCGFKRKSDDLQKEWNGLRVCRDTCWEPRHPQEFLRGRKDDSSVPWTRSEGVDVEIDTSGWADTKTDVPTGTNNGDL